MHPRLTMANAVMIAILIAIVCVVSSDASAHARHSDMHMAASAHAVVVPDQAGQASSALVEMRSYQRAVENHSHLLGDADCAGLNCCGSCSASLHVFAADPYIAGPIRRAFRMLPSQAEPIVGITPDDLNRPPQSLA
jgi:hypothetical protein